MLPLSLHKSSFQTVLLITNNDTETVELAVAPQIIFMLNLLGPVTSPSTTAPLFFRGTYSRSMLFLCLPFPRLHTKRRRKQNKTTPRNVKQPIAVDTSIVLRSRENVLALVPLEMVSLESVIYIGVLFA